MEQYVTLLNRWRNLWSLLLKTLKNSIERLLNLKYLHISLARKNTYIIFSLERNFHFIIYIRITVLCNRHIHCTKHYAHLPNNVLARIWPTKQMQTDLALMLQVFGRWPEKKFIFESWAPLNDTYNLLCWIKIRRVRWSRN